MSNSLVTVVVIAWITRTLLCLPVEKTKSVNEITFDWDKLLSVDQVSEPRPITIDHHCANITNVKCTDPYFCIDMLYCECEPGWYGVYCQVPCTLRCVHGSCSVARDLSSLMDIAFCNCPPGWEGELCDHVAQVKAPFSFGHSQLQPTIVT
nr:hypothetical protein BgiMline_016370 [Biomphalaria glabrata]